MTDHTDRGPLRIGILGAARIAPMALIRPARQVPAAAITAVAARDRGKADAFARKHGIGRVHDSYDALLADPDIDAIYNPLPNGLHCVWTIRALEAGKHVLCEKPIASNAAEAEQMAQAASRTGLVLMEAFHYRYHPLAARMRAIIDSGDLGTIRHVETHMCIPLPFPNDIRYRYDLAGGAAMDVGCYTISLLRFLAGAEPEVTHAEARLSSPKVDRYMEADFRFADGRSGRMTCSLFSAALLRIRALVRGDRGELRVINPVAPHLWHRLSVRTERGTTSERVAGDATYTHQLRAFVAAVRDGTAVPTDATDGIANMRVIDAVYRAAGLPPRGT
ncbi:MAG: Gfo/Idh/MocA family oxidoreductase [Deltaproteobacteria bacterium]|nr:Gfo/Idh/MocA family oxidoreductase [Deltaproteobacteria bacterium]MBI3389493.1 Gfo/Idh/MocA family oxidoreductase [Deltaproteobacteria bacterium]